MAGKLGVFLCNCGPNIGEKMSVPDLAAFARSLPGVTAVWTHALLCSAEGQSFLEERIRESDLGRVVVGGCSPREHEGTFRKVLEQAGRNAFQLQMANLREQCAWVTPNPDQAGEKARALIRAAVLRVREQEPIAAKDLEVNPDVLVVGAGVAGLSAALDLAGGERRVYLIDRAPFLGGKTVLYEKVFPGLECGSCLLSPWIDRVLHEKSITVYPATEIAEIKGAFGNFRVRLQRRNPGIDPDRCLACGACQEVCPVRVKNEHLGGLAERAAIYIPFPGAMPGVAVLDRTHCLHHRGQSCRVCLDACPLGAIALDREDEFLDLGVGALVLATGFEGHNSRSSGGLPEDAGRRVWSGLETEVRLNSSGPTGGRVLLPDGREPERVGILFLSPGKREGSEFGRVNPFTGAYLKLAHQIKEQNPGVEITFFYDELNLKDVEAVHFFQNLMGREGIDPVRLEPGRPPEIMELEGRVRVEFEDLRGRRHGQDFELVIAAEDLYGSRETSALAESLHLPRDASGFWMTQTSRLEPVNTPAEGVWAIGAARGPRDIPESVLDGQAAAGRISARLVPGQKIVLEPLTARVEVEYCSGCRICLERCPYLALEWDPEQGAARVNGLLCRGCGICAVICPSGALGTPHYEDRQVAAEIQGLLHAEGH